MNTNRYFIGDSCLCWSFGDQISKDISDQVLRIFRSLNRSEMRSKIGILDLAPSYNALAVYFDPAGVSIDRFIQQIEAEISFSLDDRQKESIEIKDKAAIHRIPVVYSGDDLQRVADLNNLSVAEVVCIHQEPEYSVAMIGFQPHFPYLIGLDDRLETPRLDSPRTKVPEGSVAIGGAQTGIYPKESPGGWNILGTTDPGLLLNIEPGDIIKFEEVSRL